MTAVKRAVQFALVLVLGLGFVTWIASLLVHRTTREWFEREGAPRWDMTWQQEHGRLTVEIAQSPPAYHLSLELEIVTVNLDDDPARAVQALNAAQIPGHHLHAPGGLDRSPLAAAYGIQMVPHVLLIGKDNKVANKNAQTGPAFKDEIEKLLK